jgi:hypothetical protein
MWTSESESYFLMLYTSFEMFILMRTRAPSAVRAE